VSDVDAASSRGISNNGGVEPADGASSVIGANTGVGAAGKTVAGEAAPIAPLDWSIVSKTGETRAAHINAQHGNLNLQKPSQGVFYGDPVAVTNDAWAIAQTQGIKPITANGVDIYVIPRPNSGYAGGYKGVGDNLNFVTILTEPGTSKMITSYPGNGTPLPKAP
jgi:filamentous hemagglutinin